MVAPAVLVAGLTMAAFAAARARLASFAQERSRADPADVFRRRCCLRRRAWRLARSRKRETALLLQACFDAPVVCGGAREACLVRARHNPRRCCRRVSTPLLFAAARARLASFAQDTIRADAAGVFRRPCCLRRGGAVTLLTFSAPFEGARNAGRAMRPQPHAQSKTSARVRHHESTGQIRRSARGGFIGLLRALPGGD